MSWMDIVGIVLILIGYALVLAGIAEGVELSIVGHSSGVGAHILSFSGDCLNATIQQGAGCSSWNVTAGGWA